MGWSVERFEVWFHDFHSSPDGRRACAACAQKRHIAEFADDLYQDWYLSIRSTVDSMRSANQQLPSWLGDDESARRYSLRALDNDAIDIVRHRGRLPVSASVYTDGTGNPLDDLVGPADSYDSPESAVATREASDGLNGVRRTLATMMVSGTGGCPGCKALMSVQLALGVLELLTDGRASTDSAEVRGGTDEWDRALYAALERVAPERVGRSDGRMDARTRQLKRRCGDCARRLLGDLVGSAIGGGGPGGEGGDD
ncbi:MAG: hypothetical protein U0Q22_15065 [Acidimicrobiales bacterium]